MGRKAERPQRDAVRAAVLKRDGYRCRLASGLTPSLHGGGPTYHHLLKEGQGGAYTVENGICLCAWCNAWVEAEPNEAWRLGLVQRRGETPAVIWRRLWAHGLSSSPEPGSPPVRFPYDGEAGLRREEASVWRRVANQIRRDAP